MQPTGDELRGLLSRREPSADFAARVMEQVRAEPKPVRRFPFKRWSIVGAIAASLIVGIYVRQQRRGVEPVTQVIDAETAAEQILQTLGTAGYKFNLASDAVFGRPAQDSEPQGDSQ